MRLSFRINFIKRPFAIAPQVAVSARTLAPKRGLKEKLAKRLAKREFVSFNDDWVARGTMSNNVRFDNIAAFRRTEGWRLARSTRF